jgi:small-conductance mechanosensitive channel
VLLGTVVVVEGNSDREPQPERRRNRPLRAIATLVIAVAAAVAVQSAGLPLHIDKTKTVLHRLLTPTEAHLVTIVGTIVFFVFALIATFAIARWARTMLEPVIGLAYGDIVRYVTILIGIIIVALTSLSMLGFRVAQLAAAGALTGVLISIAAQQSLSNLFAGMILQFARPFRVGESVRLRAGAIGGTIEGTVAEFGITYVKLDTTDGPMLLPNGQVLAAAVSPVRPGGLEAADG